MREHWRAAVSRAEYFGRGHFIEAVFANRESEFPQMGMFIVLTLFLYQKGSSESKKTGAIKGVDVIPEIKSLPRNAPSAALYGGWRLKVYQNSLSIALFSLFAVSFVLHV